jgi:transcriptional regulator with XRE-family HTH domain
MERKVKRIPEDMLAETWYAFMHDLLREVQDAYRRSKMTQDDIAARIGRDPAFISRCLHGKQNMTVRTMNNIARAMDCRLNVSLDDLQTLTHSNAVPANKKWQMHESGHLEQQSGESGTLLLFVSGPNKFDKTGTSGNNV